MSKVEDVLADVKVGDVINASKLGKLLKRDEDEKKPSKLVIIFAIIGVVVAVAAAIYGIYRFFTPDYLDDFEDDFEDEFDNDFFEDEDDAPSPAPAAESKRTVDAPVSEPAPADDEEDE
jgi:hypothetical protein